MVGGNHREKRASRRYNRTASLECSVFNQRKRFPAEMVNYGKDGAQIVTQTHFAKGAVLVLRLKDSEAALLASDHAEGFRSISLAEVKWCRAFKEADVSRYGLGVKYF